MGPEASQYTYKTLIDLSLKEFGAKNNDDFPEIILASIPVPDFISSDKNKKEALKILENRVKQFNNLKLSHMAIACNTAHVLLPYLKKISKVSFISMIEEVAKDVKKGRLKRVGLISTPSTIRFGLYQKALYAKKIETIIPSQKDIQSIEKIIRNVIAGNFPQKDVSKIVKIAKSMQNQGAEAIILGCTETPIIFPTKFSIPVFNSVEILSRALLRVYYK